MIAGGRFKRSTTECARERVGWPGRVRGHRREERWSDRVPTNVGTRSGDIRAHCKDALVSLVDLNRKAEVSSVGTWRGFLSPRRPGRPSGRPGHPTCRPLRERRSEERAQRRTSWSCDKHALEIVTFRRLSRRAASPRLRPGRTRRRRPERGAYSRLRVPSPAALSRISYA